MAWKMERWLRDVFPGQDHIYGAYRHLSDRELAIVAGGVLDLALADLIMLRLADHEKESEAFLGLDGNGAAPAGSFGARIQLALVLGIVTSEDARILRALKSIRNAFAHRISVNFCSQAVQPHVRSLFTHWFERTQRLAAANDWPDAVEGLRQLGCQLEQTPEAGEGLLLAVFTMYQAYFHRISERLGRIGDAVTQGVDG